MFRAMRVGGDLVAKALCALEEAVQQCRYGKPERSFALRFALAYLYARNPGDRAAFEDLWRALDGWNDLHRWRDADRALARIYQLVGRERDEAISDQFWRIAHAQAESRRQR
jgi:hypothetical protein